MKHISVLIKPASSLCNIRCKYCFYANISSLRDVKSHGKMKDETTKRMIENIFVDLDNGDELTLVFQGGEPTLAGISYYKKLIKFVEDQPKKVNVHYSIQTNGMIINERWCQLFKANKFLVGLSIDGTQKSHDLNRVDTKNYGTFQRVLRTKKLFNKYGIEYNVLCVLTSSLAKEAEKVYQFIKENNINYVQFIPCLDDLNVAERNDYAISPKDFAMFYQQFFKLWMEDLRSGIFISIKLFDDIFNLMINRRISACGLVGSCLVQNIIEADGSVYPCDFYVLDEYRMGYIQEKSIRKLFEHHNAKKFICERAAIPSRCKRCSFFQVCRGGCKRMTDAVYVDKQGYCGYQQFLEEFVPKLEEISLLLQGVNM